MNKEEKDDITWGAIAVILALLTGSVIVISALWLMQYVTVGFAVYNLLTANYWTALWWGLSALFVQGLKVLVGVIYTLAKK